MSTNIKTKMVILNFAIKLGNQHEYPNKYGTKVEYGIMETKIGT